MSSTQGSLADEFLFRHSLSFSRLVRANEQAEAMHVLHPAASKAVLIQASSSPSTSSEVVTLTL
jgi:hypothetical protein